LLIDQQADETHDGQCFSVGQKIGVTDLLPCPSFAHRKQYEDSVFEVIYY